MTKALVHNIGAFIDATPGVPPLADLGGTVNGVAVDRQGKFSATLHVAGGVATGGPTAQSIDAKFQDSLLVGGPFSDILPLVDFASVQLTADDTDTELDVDLHAARRFIRIVTTVAFTGGAAPTWPLSATLILGAGDERPV